MSIDFHRCVSQSTNRRHLGGGPILGSGSACLRGALCVAPFEKMPRFTQIRSGTSPQVTWRPRSAACPRNAPPTRCHPTIRLGGPWGNGSYVQFLPAPPQAATSSVAICQTNCGWPLTDSAGTSGHPGIKPGPQKKKTCKSMDFHPCVGQFTNRRHSGGILGVAPSWGAVQRVCVALSDWRPLKKCRGLRRFARAPPRR